MQLNDDNGTRLIELLGVNDASKCLKRIDLSRFETRDFNDKTVTISCDREVARANALCSGAKLLKFS